MKVGCVKEIKNNEFRVGLTPDNVKAYAAAGHDVLVEKGAGLGSGFTDEEYEAAGAECISVLTEPKWFRGSGSYLSEISKMVRTPCIRKDFTVDPYMIYEAKVLGASAVLLICSLLDRDTVAACIRIADSLGLSALVEAHDAGEIRQAVDAGARMIGVNNRNLKDFTVDVSNSGRLRDLVPDNILFVAESGIRTAADVRILRECGTDACLVGEALMRAPDKAAMLGELRGLQ